MQMTYKLKRLSLVVAVVAVAAFALAACGTPAATASGQAVTVNVTLSDFKIDSSLTTFSTGVPYHFVVTNNGSVNHQALILPPEPGQHLGGSGNESASCRDRWERHRAGDDAKL